jgi:hypothetical protein
MAGPKSMKKAPDLMVKNPRPVVSLNVNQFVLEEGVSVKSHTDGIDEDLVDPGKPFINGVITELSGTNGKESTDSTQGSGSFGERIVDE